MLLEDAFRAHEGVDGAEVRHTLDEALDGLSLAEETEHDRRLRIAKENDRGHRQLMALAGMGGDIDTG